MPNIQKSAQKQRLDKAQLDNALYKILKSHLKGGKQKHLSRALQALSKQENLSTRALYQDAYISPRKRRILAELLWVEPNSVPTQKTLLAWMEKHAQANQGYRHLEDFDCLLTLADPGRSWPKVLGLSLVSVLFSAAFLNAASDIVPQIRNILRHTLKITASVFKNTPLLLLVYNSIFILAQTFYSFHYDQFKTPEKRLQNWLAGTLRPAFSLTAYSLCLAANGVFTPLSIGFIIASSLVNVLDSLWNFYQIISISDKPLASAPLGERLNYVRQEERLARARTTIALDFTASVSILALVIILEAFPPTLILTASVTACILLVALANSLITQIVHTNGAEALQRALKKESNPGAIPAPAPNTTSAIFNFFSTTVPNAMSQVLGTQAMPL
jgi:hypothetical protein